MSATEGSSVSESTAGAEPPAAVGWRDEDPTHRSVVALLVAGGLLAVLIVGVAHLPRESEALPAIASYATQIAMPLWKTTEPVNEIVYGTRGFDTFGETFLLLAAVVCVTLLSRHREHRRGFVGEHEAGQREQSEDDPAGGGGEPAAQEAERVEVSGPAHGQTMTVIVGVATRVVSPLLAVAGVYLAAWGYSPGGGFPAGAVLAGVVLLVYAGFGYQRVARVVRPGLVEAIELAGALLIIICELLGYFLQGSFSANWVPLAPLQTIRSGGILQLFSGSELIEVATGLTLAIFALITMSHDWAPDQDVNRSERRGRQ